MPTDGRRRTLKRDEHGWFLPTSTTRRLACVILAPSNFNESKSSRYDETWNWRWNIGNGVVLAGRGTDHQSNGSRSRRSPDSPASRKGQRAAAECALGNRSG